MAQQFRWLFVKVTLMICLYFCPIATADGQDVSFPVRAPDKAEHRRFFDRTNLALTAAEVGALLADGVTTQRVFKRYGAQAREVDPVARPFVSAGWSGQIVGGCLFVTADLALRYALHKKHHHRVERWLPLVLITYGTIGAVHNVKVLDAEYERSYRVRVQRRFE
jgi:hypothetical protein